MVFHHKNPCNCVVLAPFSEHLSASKICNTLIYSIFKSRADSDRCFSTFIFYSHALSYVMSPFLGCNIKKDKGSLKKVKNV